MLTRNSAEPLRCHIVSSSSPCRRFGTHYTSLISRAEALQLTIAGTSAGVTQKPQQRIRSYSGITAGYDSQQEPAQQPGEPDLGFGPARHYLTANGCQILQPYKICKPSVTGLKRRCSISRSASPLAANRLDSMQCSMLSSRTQRAAAQAPASSRRAVIVQATYQSDAGRGGSRGRGRFSRRPQEERVEHKEFLYLPKPNHLVYIKPTVAVVADVASRASVGLKMTIGPNQLERYVIEYYSKRL